MTRKSFLTNKSTLLPFILALLYFKITLCQHFPTPEILKYNVAFWKKIYTEISLKEGLLHDYEYPMIIYKKIYIGTKSSHQRKRIIRNEIEQIKTLLSTIETQPESTWPATAKEIVALFNKYATVDALKDAADRIRFQRGQRERYKRGLYRSGAYLDTIKAIFTQYNIPQRLIYLPHVESSFTPSAYSKVGAAGLWQFMRGTGRIYMTINYSIDERRDPILATRAAAKLLSHNYKEIKAWPLAITAYNHGLNGMKRAVAQTGSRDISVIIQKYKGRLFRFASKNFYSCFLAASEIAMNPEKYFPDITYASPIQYQDITLEYYMRPKDLAQYSGISEKELEELNPAIRPIVFRHNKLIPKAATIHLPVSLSIASVKQSLGNLPDSLKVTTPPRPEYYQVVRGDNLYSIARRLGVSARDIALENNINRLNRIYAGQVLRIPEAAGSEKAVVTQIVKVEEKAEVKQIEEQAAVKTTPSQPSPAEEVPDTLTEIIMAKAESVPRTSAPDKTGRLNKFDAEIYNFEINFSEEENSAAIRISLNETIGHYADWLGIPTQSIREANYMGRGSTIRINQELTVPVDKETLEQFNRRRLEYHMALEEDFYSQYKITELKVKIIQRGETLWDICNEDGVIPLWLLKKYNKLIDIGQLFPNMKIWLPVVEEKTEKDYKQEANKEWRGVYPTYQEPYSISKSIQILY